MPAFARFWLAPAKRAIQGQLYQCHRIHSQLSGSGLAMPLSKIPLARVLNTQKPLARIASHHQGVMGGIGVHALPCPAPPRLSAHAR